jgi:hypothetical protein
MTGWEMQNELRQTMSGHWHPGGDAACDVRCPMGDPRSAGAFRRLLDAAVLGGEKRVLSGYGDR